MDMSLAPVAVRGLLPRHVPGEARITSLARIVVVAIVIGLAVSYLAWALLDWHMADAGAYWQAALRLREGAPLYPPVTNLEASDVYRYAPWFAWLTVPFTLLPIQVAGALWSAILVAASCVAVRPLIREGQWLPALFFWPILIGISASGNVHALMVAALVLGVERRSGPLWIALAASLKAVPILLVLVYVGRREWGRAAMTLGLTAALVAPMLLYDLSAYPTNPGGAGMLISWPAIYAAAVVDAAIVTLWLARSRFSWVAAATGVALALPRFFVYDATLLLVGTAHWRPSAVSEAVDRPAVDHRVELVPRAHELA